jgi:hypothetical protein
MRNGGDDAPQVGLRPLDDREHFAARLHQDRELEGSEEVARARAPFDDRSGGAGSCHGGDSGHIHGDGRTGASGGRVDHLVQNHAKNLAGANMLGEIQTQQAGEISGTAGRNRNITDAAGHGGLHGVAVYGLPTSDENRQGDLWRD